MISQRELIDMIATEAAEAGCASAWSARAEQVKSTPSLSDRVKALEQAVYELRLARHCLEYPPGHAEHDMRKPKPPEAWNDQSPDCMKTERQADHD